MSTNVKIVGIEGHSLESLRDAVARNAKFVFFSYNFSLVVISFKRSTNIYFVKPGESRIMKGLPYTLLSLTFGWWGIPWGIIYTIQTLATNLSGGTDVTAEVIASFAPSQTSAANTPPPLR
jgi:hypothetical protein